jgi:hypothetical protein
MFLAILVLVSLRQDSWFIGLYLQFVRLLIQKKVIQFIAIKNHTIQQIFLQVPVHLPEYFVAQFHHNILIRESV